MTGTNLDGDERWDRGWREHKIRQMVRLAGLPFAEKLAWLESAQGLVNELRKPQRSIQDGRGDAD